MFFSTLSKYYREYKEYLEDFYEYFIKKYIFLDKNLKKISSYDYQKDKNFDLSNFDNYIFLIVSNDQEAIDSINNSKHFENEGREVDVEKCFKLNSNLKIKHRNISPMEFHKIDNTCESSRNDDVKKDIKIKNESGDKLSYS